MRRGRVRMHRPTPRRRTPRGKAAANPSSAPSPGTRYETRTMGARKLPGTHGKPARTRAAPYARSSLPSSSANTGSSSANVASISFFFSSALPDDVDLPPQGLELGHAAPVALDVALELHHPVFHVALRHARLAARAPVPETSVDEQGRFLARPRHVGTARHLPLQTVAPKPRRAQPRAHEKLRLGVGALVALHRLAHLLVGGRRRHDAASGRQRGASGKSALKRGKRAAQRGIAAVGSRKSRMIDMLTNGHSQT